MHVVIMEFLGGGGGGVMFICPGVKERNIFIFIYLFIYFPLLLFTFFNNIQII